MLSGLLQVQHNQPLKPHFHCCFIFVWFHALCNHPTTQPSPWESTIRLSRPWGIPLIVSLLVDLGALHEHFSTFNEANVVK